MKAAIRTLSVRLADGAAGREDKPDAPEEGEKPKDDGKPVEAGKPKGPDIVKKSVSSTHLVVVGNATFISDPIIGNGGEGAEITAALALNLIQWLAGSPDLIALRAGG